ncbi:MAG: ComEC/Rec2 family competence protein [Clostridia bacterium]|nr:ComEC/Rec2 family competence protein [Clostridia bacterium]
MSKEATISEPLRLSPFYYRPLCLLSAVLVLCLAAFILFGELAVAFALLMAFAYVIFWLIVLRSSRAPLPWMVLGIVIISIGIYGVYSVQRGKTLEFAFSVTDPGRVDGSGALGDEDIEGSNKKEVKAEIISEYYSESFGCSYYVRLIEINGVKAYGHAVLNADSPINARPYDTVYAGCRFSEYEGFGAYGSDNYAISKDILFQMETDSALVVAENTRGFMYNVQRLQEKIEFRLRELLEPPAATFAMAVLFGERSGMSKILERDFSSTGITHLLAVSGSHFSVLAGAISFLLERARFSKRRQIFPILIFTVVFSALSGFSNAVLRAALMLIFTLTVRFIGYKSDSLISLFVSVAAICAVKPYAIFDVGLQLSFAATLGLLLQIGRFRINTDGSSKAVVALSMLWESVKLTLAATLFTFPVIAFSYGSVSLMTVPVNVIAGPTVTVAMFTAIILLAVSGIGWLSEMVAWVFQLIYRMLSVGLGVLAVNTDTAMSLKAPQTLYILFFLACSYLLLRLLGSRRRMMAFVPLTASLVVLISITVLQGFTARNRVTVSLVSQEDNESIVLYSGRSSLICDLSDGSSEIALMAADEVTNGLYDTDIDGYMLTHYHVDHVSSLGKLMRSYYVRTVYLPEPMDDGEEQLAKAIGRLADSCGSRVVYYSFEKGFEFAGVDIEACASEHFVSSHKALFLRFTVLNSNIAYIGEGFREVLEGSERLTSLHECDTVILGAHGPGTRDEAHPLLVTADTKIYISPGCDVSVNSAVRLIADEDGKGVFRFRLGSGTKNY